jgi:hypothetical protein
LNLEDHCPSLVLAQFASATEAHHDVKRIERHERDAEEIGPSASLRKQRSRNLLAAKLPRDNLWNFGAHNIHIQTAAIVRSYDEIAEIASEDVVRTSISLSSANVFEFLKKSRNAHNFSFAP